MCRMKMFNVQNQNARKYLAQHTVSVGFDFVFNKYAANEQIECDLITNIVVSFFFLRMCF